MIKNTAGQKVRFFFFDYTTGAPKTGDAANLTAYVAKDRGSLTALTDTSATEISSSNQPGVYEFDVSQAETNATVLDFSCKSSTASVVSIPLLNVFTLPPNLGATAIDSSGNVAANIVQAAGTAWGSGALTAAALAADAGAEIADAVLDEVVEGSLTLRQIVRIILATTACKVSGLDGATALFRDSGDTKNRVTATTDTYGNRSAVTFDAT